MAENNKQAAKHDGEVVEINVFVRTADGFDAHIKMAGPYNGGTVKRLGELSAALSAAGFTPSTRHHSGGTPSEPAGPACPVHGPEKVAPSKFGSGFYCKARNGDGTYCQWTSEPKVRRVK